MEAAIHSVTSFKVSFLFNSIAFFLESELGKRKHIFQS